MYTLWKTTIRWIVFGLVITALGCAKRTLVPFEELPVPSEVELQLQDGRQVQAIALEKSSDKLTVQKQFDTRTLQINRQAIRSLSVLPSEYDESGKLITRTEIAREKSNKNTLIYSIGGGVLSFGVSLFISSIVYRGTGEDFQVANPISIGGGVVGTALLFWQGKKRDRVLALERIKDQRKLAAEQELKKKRAERDQLRRQLEQLKLEKAQVEAEKQKLERKLKKKKK